MFAEDDRITRIEGNALALMLLDFFSDQFEIQHGRMAIGENGGTKLYLVSGDNILWQKDIEGEIQELCLNPKDASDYIHKFEKENFELKQKLKECGKYLDNTQKIINFALSNKTSNKVWN